MFTLLRVLGQDAERIESALQTVGGLEPLLTQLNERLTDMATFKEIVLKGLDYLAEENAKLREQLASGDGDSEALKAELAAKSTELAQYLADETAEDAADDADRQAIIARLGELVPPAPTEPEVVPPGPEPGAEAGGPEAEVADASSVTLE